MAGHARSGQNHPGWQLQRLKAVRPAAFGLARIIGDEKIPALETVRLLLPFPYTHIDHIAVSLTIGSCETG